MTIKVANNTPFEKSMEWTDKNFSIQTGKIARQADGALVASMGNTSVLISVVFNKKIASDVVFFPLSVTYKETFAAAGRIPGGFIKRESKPSEQEILSSRVIDRSIRPLFHKDFHHEVQVIASVMSYDPEYDPTIVSINGAAAALAISGIPLTGQISAVRMAYVKNEVIINPSKKQLASSELDLIISGDSNNLWMIESSSKNFAEESMHSIIKQGMQHLGKMIEFIQSIKNEVGKQTFEYTKTVQDTEIVDKITNSYKDQILEGFNFEDKRDMLSHFEKIKSFITIDQEDTKTVEQAFEKAKRHILREKILNTHERIAGRKATEIRSIDSVVSIFERTHGSSLFTRGNTQALANVTLGTEEDEQLIDSLSKEQRERFFLHYNFPPYSVGECGAIKAPSRREIGHGRLASKALQNVIPPKAKFPYTIRVTSEITESDGSSSQATVCAATLALMDAGVPINHMVAGIAIGLIKDNDKHIILSDISAEEDYAGDIDFKVAGTSEGITALQMDTKTTGISLEILAKALKQAQEGIIHILSNMSECISAPREEISKYAPIINVITIPRSNIKDLIGSGGRVIKEICEKSKSKISIEDDGKVKIASPNKEKMELAIELVKNSSSSNIEVGAKFEGTVVKIINAGLFVNFLGTKDGFVHISEITEGHIDNIYDHVNEGEKVKVVVLNIENGKIRLSMKRINDSLEDIMKEHQHSKERSRAKPPRRDFKSNPSTDKSPYRKKQFSDTPYNEKTNTSRKYFN